jgi:hypothetical protein
VVGKTLGGSLRMLVLGLLGVMGAFVVALWVLDALDTLGGLWRSLVAVQLEVPVDNTITRIFDPLVGNSPSSRATPQKFPARRNRVTEDDTRKLRLRVPPIPKAHFT